MEVEQDPEKEERKGWRDWRLHVLGWRLALQPWQFCAHPPPAPVWWTPTRCLRRWQVGGGRCCGSWAPRGRKDLEEEKVEEAATSQLEDKLALLAFLYPPVQLRVVRCGWVFSHVCHVLWRQQRERTNPRQVESSWWHPVKEVSPKTKSTVVILKD